MEHLVMAQLSDFERKLQHDAAGLEGHGGTHRASPGGLRDAPAKRGTAIRGDGRRAPGDAAPRIVRLERGSLVAGCLERSALHPSAVGHGGMETDREDGRAGRGAG